MTKQTTLLDILADVVTPVICAEEFGYDRSMWQKWFIAGDVPAVKVGKNGWITLRSIAADWKKKKDDDIEWVNNYNKNIGKGK